MKDSLVKKPFHLPYNPKLVARAKEMRKNMTVAERKLWNEFLNGTSVKIYPQRPIDQYIVDFYCPKHKLVIEVDGDIHASDDSIEYDLERDSVLEGYGLKVLRFKNFEIMNDFAGVCKKIIGILDPPQPPFLRGESEGN